MPIPKMTDGAITVKAYAEENHISMQSVYAKINRNSEKLKGHILKQNGKMLLDVKAQEILKPTGNNYRLTQKVGNIENTLREKSYESDKYKKLNEELNNKCEKQKEQLAERDSKIKILEQELCEYKHTIEVQEQKLSENRKLISVLADKATISKNFEERLNALLSVFENNANTSAIEKLGKLLTGKH